MKKKYIFKLLQILFFTLFTSLLFLSCGNLFSNIDEATNRTAYSSVRFVANMQTQENNLSISSRSAIPVLELSDTENIHYFVRATATGKSTRFAHGMTPSLAIELDSDTSWKILCGIGKISQLSDPNTGAITEKILEEDIYLSSCPEGEPEEIPISPLNPVLIQNFALLPASGGSGYLSLRVSVTSDSGIEIDGSNFNDRVSFECSEITGLSDKTELTYTATSEVVLSTKTNQSIPSGQYQFTIKFKNNSGILYETIQTVNIINKMTTKKWVSDGQVIGSDGVFKVTKALVDNFLDTSLYVGIIPTLSGMSDIRADNNNSGTAFEPLETISGAISKIATCGSSSKDYHIYVSGEHEENVYIDSSLNTKAASITIEGYTAPDNSGKPTAKLLGKPINNSAEDAALNIDSGIPVTVKNLWIKPKEASPDNKYTRGIYVGSSNSLTVDGVLISGFNSSEKYGAGICINNTNAQLKAVNSSIENNTSAEHGGGIFIYGDCTKNHIIENCKISENHAKYGAGLSVIGAKLKIYRSSITDNYADIDTNHNVGGGIYIYNNDDYVKADVTLGSGCIIRGNKARCGGGISNAGGYLTIDGAQIINNQAVNQKPSTSTDDEGWGGGIEISDYGRLDILSGIISGNTSQLYGGGICINSFEEESYVNITGGKIENNSALTRSNNRGKGGAIYSSGEIVDNEPFNFYLGGSASIPAGTSNTNDIYLGKANFQSTISLKSPLINHSQSSPVSITIPEESSTRGVALVKAITPLTSLEACKNSFAIESDDWNLKLSSDKKTLALDSPIWVAGTGAKQGTGSPSTTGPGKKAQPFDTIDNACRAMTDSNVDYTILIDGTLSGNQTISAASAKSITICGASPLPTTGDDAGIPQDKIDAGGTMDDEYLDSDTKSALNIEAAVSVTIENLMITGGRQKEQGGGIRLYVDEGEADLTLSSGAYVTKNKAKRNGGGVFVGHDCSLTIEDGAVIKGNKAINTTLASDASCCGGGVFVYEDSTLTMTGGTICENSAATGGVGGGVYCGRNVDFSMSGGKICSNSAIQGSTGRTGTGEGGGVACYSSNFTMTGGVIGDDSTSATATSTTDCSNYVDYITSSDHQQGGGGIYYESSDNSKEMKLLGGTIARNYSSNHGGGVCVKAGKVTVKNTISYNCANEGGGVYNAGAFAMSGGKIYGNSAGNQGNGIMVSKFNGQEAQLEIQGCAYLPPDNVICLGEGTSVKITGTLTPTDTGASGGAVTCSTATITPTDYDSAILTAADGINLEDWIGYFVITPRNGDAALIDGLAYGVGVDGKFDTSRILVTKSSDEVRDALYELTSHANEPVNICFATDFKPTTVLSETLDPESSGASGVQYRGLLKFYEGVTVNLSATKPVVIGESYTDYGSVIVTKKTNLTIGPNIKLVGNRKAEVLYQRGGNVTLNGCEITGSYGSTYAGLFVFATKEYGQALATINSGTKIHHNSGSGIRLQKMSDSSDCPDAILIMHGGDIYANGDNSEYHAGVTVYYGKVTKTGGRIYGNFGYTNQGPNKPSQVYFYKNGYWRNDSSNSYVKYEDKTRWTSEQ